LSLLGDNTHHPPFCNNQFWKGAKPPQGSNYRLQRVQFHQGK
jgi:hypothetical protein